MKNCSESFEQLRMIDQDAYAHIKQDLNENCVCTGNAEGLGVCIGDSGDGLVWDGKLIGIASTTFGCAKGFPDIYTKVSSFIDWIKETIVELHGDTPLRMDFKM